MNATTNRHSQNYLPPISPPPNSPKTTKLESQTKSKRLTILGLVSIACVAVAMYAQSDGGIELQSFNSIRLPEPDCQRSIPDQPETQTYLFEQAASPVPSNHSRVPRANRIPVVDRTGTPTVQLANFDSIEWQSQVDASAPIPTLPENTHHLSIPHKASDSDHSQSDPTIPEAFTQSSPNDSSVTAIASASADDSGWAPEPILQSRSGIQTGKRLGKRIANPYARNTPFESPSSPAVGNKIAGKKIVNLEFDHDSKSVKPSEISFAVVPGTNERQPKPLTNNEFQPDAAVPQTTPLPVIAADDNSFEDRLQVEPDGFEIENVSPRQTIPSRIAQAGPLLVSFEPAEPELPSPEPQDADNLPRDLQSASSFVMAEQPAMGDHWKDDRPVTDKRTWLIDPIKSDFSPDPIASDQPYDSYDQMHIYEGKTLNANQRPIVELGRPWYQLGQLSPGSSILGKHNNVTPQFLVYGDVRTAVASNTQNGDNVSQLAFEVNLDFDLKLTSTERFHMFMSPVDNGQNTRWLFDEGDFVEEFDADIDFGYFEGDLGAIVGGFTDQTLPFDFPFAVGVMPLLMQNGVWMEDAFLGVAATLPARNSPKLNISNMDITFFAGYDKINSDAFAGDDSAARMYGVASFIEAMNGYIEIDYAFLDDRTFDDRSYHNIGIGFSRRFGRLFSNSTRVIVNAGQSTDAVENTADGVLLLSENSLITSSPSTVVPYMNFFIGFDRPQSAARAAAAGGVLRNTGILFESDGMTNYPTLDATANDAFGGAFGLNLLADDFSQQLIVELAALGVMGDDTARNAPGPQYGVGVRYQLPLTNAVIFRTDGMLGFLEDGDDVRGLRFELRHKY